MLRKWCTSQISGPQGGPNEGQGGQMGSKNKVWLKMLKIALLIEKSGFLNFEIFSPYLQNT